jgi:isoamylase
MKNEQVQAIQKKRGAGSPLGATRKGDGINFALFSEHAIRATLCLFKPASRQPFLEIPLDPEQNRTGSIWHILLSGLPSEPLEYGYRLEGEHGHLGNVYLPKIPLSDPYARGLSTKQTWGARDPNGEIWPPLGKIILDIPFDWGETAPPKIPKQDLIIYEMHVRSFTHHPSSQVKAPGTFLGIIEKIPYLKKLGVNAIELMPIFEFDECENKHVHPKSGKKLHNYWGYSTINFFSPMNRYSSSQGWTAALDDFRTLVKEMHKNDIEVYLDVVYNHTAEGNEEGPLFSFRGIDNRVYYMINPEGLYRDFTGTGNTVNANHPVVAQFILDSLRFWAGEMHVDGFRFDLASSLTRDDQGTPLSKPPVIEAITADPILSNVKFIAEAWDAAGLYQVGSFPGEGRWYEWNGKYRDVARRFLKGTDAQSGEFAQVMTGSQDLYGNGRKPYHSINFITAHDGFTLRDLVSYQEKHNLENAENNQDGASNNDSWNCGQEGPTSDPKINTLRQRQMRNFHAALMLALGTPMILMGDEYGHTRGGNNNAYCQDSELNWFLWDELSKEEGFARFHRLMTQFRRDNPLLRRTEFLQNTDVTWHGHLPGKVNWSPENRLVAYTLKEKTTLEHLYIAFNAHFASAHLELPQPPQNKKWYLIVDTSLPSPRDFCEAPRTQSPLPSTYELADHAVLIAKAL